MKTAYLFGPGPSLDLVDWDTVQYPRYAINAAGLVVPGCNGIITTDYNMLRYLERKNITTKIYTTMSRHSFRLNISYIDEHVPIWVRLYSTTAALALLHSYGFEIHARGFDAMKGIEGYASCALLKDYTDPARHTDHKPIVKHIQKYLSSSGKGVTWLS